MCDTTQNGEKKMKKIIVLLGLVALCGGCAVEKTATYYADGQIKSTYSRDGCIRWSNGDDKQVQLPLSHVSVVGK